MISQESFFLNWDTALFKAKNTEYRQQESQETETNAGSGNARGGSSKRWKTGRIWICRGKSKGYSRPGNSTGKGSVTQGLKYIPLVTQNKFEATQANFFILIVPDVHIFTLIRTANCDFKFLLFITTLKLTVPI